MNPLKSFWRWYNRHLLLNTSIAAFLFTLQLVHLYWLSADVVATRLFGHSFFHLTGIFEFFITLVDYTEIPALISTSILYINDLRLGKNRFKNIAFLIFLNSQWLHLFWITDEFVVEQLIGTGGGTVLPTWLAWVAIGIDYLELPVIYDTLKKVYQGVKEKNIKEVSKALKED